MYIKFTLFDGIFLQFVLLILQSSHGKQKTSDILQTLLEDSALMRKTSRVLSAMQKWNELFPRSSDRQLTFAAVCLGDSAASPAV